MERLAAALIACMVALQAMGATTPIPFRPKQVEPPRGAAEKKESGEAAAADDKFVLAFDTLETVAPDVYQAKGNVRFENADMLMTCDLLIYDKVKGTLRAEGNVTCGFADFSVSGAALDYDMDKKTGTVYDAIGQQKDGDYTVSARTISKTGEGWFSVDEGLFTSCNSALPPWSLKIGRGRFHIDHYAFLVNPRFTVRNLPVLYSPYLVWPIKPDRSTGFLLTNVGNSSTKGLTVGNAFYLAPSDWWDATFYHDYFEEAGNGLGTEFRYALSERSYGYLAGYYIDDRISGENRWYLNSGAVADLGRKWKLTLDVNLISDADFFRDFQRDYSKGTRGAFDSSLFLTRPLGGGRFNLILERNAEYYDQGRELTDTALPKLEFRLPSTLVKWGIYWSLEASASALSKAVGDGSDLDYLRFDLHPLFEAPLRTPPWLDVIPSLELRETYYSETQPGYAREGDDETVLRRYVVGGLSVKGPRLFRKFEGGMKHVVEPFLEGRVESSREDQGYPVYDEIDLVSTTGDEVKYGVRNRFYDKGGRLAAEAEISQAKNFDRPLSYGDGELSKRSPLLLSFRYWPKKLFSFDMRLYYNPVTGRVEDRLASISFSTPKKEQFFRFSYYYSNDPAADTAYFRAKYEELLLAASLRMFDNRCTIQPHVERDLTENKWRNARIVFWYHGSCYSIGFEAGRREIGYFTDTSVRVLVSLKQVGTVVDLFGGSEELRQ